MKIESITCTPFTIPFTSQKVFASGQMNKTEHVLVEIRCSDGLVGTAEAISRPMFYGESQRGMVAAIEDLYSPMILGKNPLGLEAIHRGLDMVPGNHTVKGAIDIALHDIIGQRAGMSCRALLGGWTDEIELTHMINIVGVEAAVDDALEAKDRLGYRNFKIKTGLNPIRDIELLRNLRRALPDDLFYIDCNQGYDGSQAARVLRAAEELDIAWAEEPCPTAHRAERQQISLMTRIPILGDESCRTLAEATQEMLDRTISMVSIKIARTGYRASQKILAVGAALGIRPLLGTQGETGVGMTAGWHFCAAHAALSARPAETFLKEIAGDILTESLVIENGRMIIEDRPGLGISIDREKLRHFQVH